MSACLIAGFIAVRAIRGLGAQAERRGETGAGSRLPAAVPIGIGCLAGAGFFLLLVFGLALQPLVVLGSRRRRVF